MCTCPPTGLFTIRRFSKHVRSFSDVPQLPDRQHRNHLVTCHWLWEQIQGKCGDLGQRSGNWGTTCVKFKVCWTSPVIRCVYRCVPRFDTQSCTRGNTNHGGESSIFFVFTVYPELIFNFVDGARYMRGKCKNLNWRKHCVFGGIVHTRSFFENFDNGRVPFPCAACHRRSRAIRPATGLEITASLNAKMEHTECLPDFAWIITKVHSIVSALGPSNRCALLKDFHGSWSQASLLDRKTPAQLCSQPSFWCPSRFLFFTEKGHRITTTVPWSSQISPFKQIHRSYQLEGPRETCLVCSALEINK